VHRKLSPADRAEIVARVGSETYAQLAAAFGVHSSRVGQIVAEARAAEDIETAALRERHRLALELVPGLAPEERFDLLVAVVAPSPALAAASRNAARPQLDREPRLCRRRRVGGCPGCGVSYADPPTVGCRPCGWREAARRRRKRAREDAL
jgi:hypothetical protein